MDEHFSGFGAYVLYAITTAMMVFILAPLLLVMAVSVSDSYFVTFPPQGFTLKWYVKVLGDRDRGGPDCLNRFSASMSGASAKVRLPSGVAAG